MAGVLVVTKGRKWEAGYFHEPTMTTKTMMIMKMMIKTMTIMTMMIMTNNDDNEG